MRLVCPNCEAQYEIPDDVIPEAGRDVQCSNCNHTWFENHPKHKAIPQPEVDHNFDVPAEQDSPQEVEHDAPPRKELDPAVSEVLREEAEREAAAREADMRGLETQQDMDLSPESSNDMDRAAQARARIQRLQGTDQDEIDPGARSDMLPEIDDVDENFEDDTHDSSYENADDIETRRKGGAGRGFLFIVVLALFLTCVYIFAPQLAEQVPATEPYLTKFVNLVNDGRVVLDAQIKQGLAWLDGLTSENLKSDQ